MKHVFIVNPVSGKADASLYLVPRLIDAAAGAGVDYAVELTQHAGHADRKSTRLNSSHYQQSRMPSSA